MRRVLAAMSGGVDSSVAAVLLQHEGWEVLGVTFDLWDFAGDPARSAGAPPAEEAARVCRRLGIPHHTVALRDEFRRAVVDPFVAAYFEGRTPNPCVVCNPGIKFDTLARLAAEHNAEAVATGHYARVDGPDAQGRYRLRKAVHERRDQSYFLCGLTQRHLALARFPLGAWDKPAVRALARDLDLPTHQKPDSQDVCFIPSNDCAAFLEREAPQRLRAGPILDMTGRVIGRHSGVHRFTLGQRKGMRQGFGARRYVVRIDPEQAAIVVGDHADTLSRTFHACGVNWVSIAPPSAAFTAWTRIRRNHAGAPAEVVPLGDGSRVRVTFERPQSAVTPGQTVVFYDDDLILGGGMIERTAPES